MLKVTVVIRCCINQVPLIKRKNLTPCTFTASNHPFSWQLRSRNGYSPVKSLSAVNQKDQGRLLLYNSLLLGEALQQGDCGLLAVFRLFAQGLQCCRVGKGDFLLFVFLRDPSETKANKSSSTSTSIATLRLTASVSLSWEYFDGRYHSHGSQSWEEKYRINSRYSFCSLLLFFWCPFNQISWSFTATPKGSLILCVLTLHLLLAVGHLSVKKPFQQLTPSLILWSSCICSKWDQWWGDMG